MSGGDTARELVERWVEGDEPRLPFIAYEETEHMAYAGEGEKFSVVMGASVAGDSRAAYEVTKAGQRIRYRLRGIVGRKTGVGLCVLKHDGQLTYGLIRKKS